MTDITIIIFIIGLLIIFLVIGYLIGKRMGEELKDREWEQKIPDIREEARKQSRAVLGGQFSQQLAPYLPDFPYSPTEVRFIGEPIDFIVFKGMDAKDIQEMIVVEVKSGKATITPHQRKLRDIIKQKRVRWEEYRIPEDITKKSI